MSAARGDPVCPVRRPCPECRRRSTDRPHDPPLPSSRDSKPAHADRRSSSPRPRRCRGGIRRPNRENQRHSASSFPIKNLYRDPVLIGIPSPSNSRRTRAECRRPTIPRFRQPFPSIIEGICRAWTASQLKGRGPGPPPADNASICRHAVMCDLGDMSCMTALHLRPPHPSVGRLEWDARRCGPPPVAGTGPGTDPSIDGAK